MKRSGIIIIALGLLVSCSTVNDIVDEISASMKTKEDSQTSESIERDSEKTIPTGIEKEDPWESIEINTVKDATYLSSIEKKIIIELNKVRTKPEEYAEYYIEPMRDLYRDNILQYPGEIALRTKEGISALEECIDALKRKKSIGTLNTTKGLHKAAEDHMEDQSNTGRTGHSGSDGSSPSQRMKRYGEWKKTAGENIAYGNDIARRIVISLLVDDGVPSRGHRKNIMNPEFRYVGVAHGTHPRIRTVTVMDFAGGYEDR